MASQLEHLCVHARRLCIGGSLIGSIKETQEMLDLCGEKNITCDVEVRRQHRANLAASGQSGGCCLHGMCKRGCSGACQAGLEASAMQCC